MMSVWWLCIYLRQSSPSLRRRSVLGAAVPLGSRPACPHDFQYWRTHELMSKKAMQHFYRRCLCRRHNINKERQPWLQPHHGSGGKGAGREWYCGLTANLVSCSKRASRPLTLSRAHSPAWRQQDELGEWLKRRKIRHQELIESR